jgi:hypothetical protein
MTQLSYQALESLWTSAGGSADLAPTMAAIAIAESGGNPNSLNDTPSTGDYSVGLWQINYFGSMLSGRTQQFGSPSALRASPTAQARAAVAIENEQGLKAWSTYSSGAYRQYLNGADYTGSGSAGSGGGGDSGGGVSQAGDITNSACQIGINLPVVGQTCILTVKQSQQLLGMALMTGGALVGLVGAIILAAYGLKSTGALDHAAAAAAVVPGGGRVAGSLAQASGAIKRGPTPSGQRREQKQRQAQQQRNEQRAAAREERVRSNQQHREQQRAAKTKGGTDGDS